MMLTLIYLQLSECSKVLLDLLTGKDNVAYLLPKKFVSNLLRKRCGTRLNLNPEVVAEAFSSIDDPLLIVSMDNVSPKISAPSAIFVDLRKSKEEITSVLLPRINHGGQTASNIVDAGTVPEVSSSNTLPDANMNMNGVKFQMNWKVLEEISEAIKENKGVRPNTLSAAAIIREELNENIGTLATALAGQDLCSGKDAEVVQMAHDIMDSLYSAFSKRLIFKQSTLNSVLSVLYRDQNLDNVMECIEVAVVWLQSHRPKIDDFLNHFVTSQESKDEQTGDEDSVVFEQTDDTIPQVSSSNTLPNTNMILNRAERKMNWKVLDEISKAITEKKGVALNKLSAAAIIKEEVDINLRTITTAVANQKSLSRKDARLVLNADDNLKLLSFAFDSSRNEVEQPAWLKSVERAVEKLHSSRLKMDKFLNRSVTSQVSKVLENQSECQNSQDGNKKGKGNDQGKKSKKSKGKKK